MILLHKELIEKYKSDYEIKKLIQEGKIFKIEKGIYSDKKDVNYLEIISKKYPNAIFTMDSAFYYHNLTDVIPEKEHLALKRDSTKISDSRIKVVYYQDKFFDIGKSTLNINGVEVKVYDKERMLIELIRNRKSIGFDYYKEIIANYREIKETLNTKKIAEYIKYNQSIISFISINELAKETKTSPATITRFSKNLGFKGYPDFQKIFQKEVEQQTSYMKGLKSSITEREDSSSVLQEMINTNIELLQEMDVLEIEKSLDQAVEWIKNSRKLYILGARGSYALAYYLYFMLKEFREGVELMISGASDFTDKLLYTQPEDLLFTISFHPYTNFTYQVTEFFKEHGNKVITVTDKKDSTLGNISDLVLTTKNGEKAYTFVPGTVIINALLVKLGIEDKENTVKKLDKLKEITDRFNIYLDK